FVFLLRAIKRVPQAGHFHSKEPAAICICHLLGGLHGIEALRLCCRSRYRSCHLPCGRTRRPWHGQRYPLPHATPLASGGSHSALEPLPCLPVFGSLFRLALKAVF